MDRETCGKRVKTVLEAKSVSKRGGKPDNVELHRFPKY
jgi:hypothetical protein